MKNQIYINLEEFQNYILKYITSEEMKKMFETTTFFNDPKNSELCFQSMQHGMIWATLLAGTSDIKRRLIIN